MRLLNVPVPKSASSVNQTTNRIVLVDCSGSMASELPKLRKHLKNKLPTIVSPGDSLTLIWFSGHNQFGVIFDDLDVTSGADLSSIHSAIDRFLVPVGMTGFLQPLQKVKEVISTSSKETATLYFMTDGCNNVGSMKNIIEICQELSEVVGNSTFVEYSYYADHNALMNMALATTGSVVLAKDFQSYSDNLERAMKVSVSSKQIKMPITGSMYDWVVGHTTDSYVFAQIKNGEVSLPGNVVSVSYFNFGSEDVIELDNPKTAVSVVAALIQKGLGDVALSVASAIGDVPLYNLVQNAFSKQDYCKVSEVCEEYATGTKALYSTEPKRTGLLPVVNAYNVLTLLMDLTSEDGNYLHITHPSFSYNSISDVRETKVEDDGYKPVFTDTAKDIKAPMVSLSFNEDRPNISVLVKRSGTVNLPQNDFGFGDSFNTFVFRNYSIIRDGIVNVSKLPVVLSKASYDLMVANGVINEPFKVGKTYVIDVSKLPVINRSMAQPSKAATLYENEFALYEARVRAKVLKHFMDDSEVSQKFASLYSEEGAKFLKEIGISEGGFSPKTVKGDSSDSYTAKVLEVKLAKLSSIPKVSDVIEKMNSPKVLNLPSQIMKEHIREIELLSQDDLMAEFVKNKELMAIYRNDIVQTKFGVIIGKRWFTDLANYNDTTLTIDTKYGPVIASCLFEDRAV